MTRYRVLPIATRYWRPGQDYLQQIIECVNGKVTHNDVVVLSEKAISTARGSILDESQVKPSLSARFIATFWMRTVWGYILGPICRLRKRLLSQIRHYPSEAGSRHKQVALRHAGLLQALMFGSEGGIDGSNLPYTYVSLPRDDIDAIAQSIMKKLRSALGKDISIMIVDTDKTYTCRNFHFTPRPNPIRGISSHGGFIAYALGRFLQLRKRSTPLALAGLNLTVEEALHIAEIANRSRGYGAGRTVWDMAEKFNVNLTDVTWEMLDRIKHKPIAIVRTIGRERR